MIILLSGNNYQMPKVSTTEPRQQWTDFTVSQWNQFFVGGLASLSSLYGTLPGCEGSWRLAGADVEGTLLLLEDGFVAGTSPFDDDIAVTSPFTEQARISLDGDLVSFVAGIAPLVGVDLAVSSPFVNMAGDFCSFSSLKTLFRLGGYLPMLKKLNKETISHRLLPHSFQ